MGTFLTWVILLALNLPLFIACGKRLFRNGEEFYVAAFKPKIHSWIDGTGSEGFWLRLKFVFLLVACVVLLYAEYKLIVVPIFGVAGD